MAETRRQYALRKKTGLVKIVVVMQTKANFCNYECISATVYTMLQSNIAGQQLAGIVLDLNQHACL